MEEKVDDIKELQEKKNLNELQLIQIRDMLRFIASKEEPSANGKTKPVKKMTFNRVVSAPYRWFGYSVKRVFSPFESNNSLLGVLGHAFRAYVLLPVVILYTLTVVPLLSMLIVGIVKRTKERKKARLLAYQRYRISTLEDENKIIDQKIAEKTKESEDLLKAIKESETKKKKRTRKKSSAKISAKPLTEVKGTENTPEMELFPDIK